MLYRRNHAGAIPVLPLVEERGFRFSAGGKLWLLLALTVSCADAAHGGVPPLQVTDDAGRRVQLAAPAGRVVSLSPSVTELFASLGASSRLLARTAFDPDPALFPLPSFGSALSPTPEAVLRLQPDLVVLGPEARTPALTNVLDASGAAVYISDPQCIEDVFTTVRRLGVLLGVERRADSLAAALRASLDSVRTRVAGRPRPSVLFLLWHSPAQTAGAGSFVDELITIAGGRNVFANAHTPWPEVSMEEIVRRDPDVLVIPSRGSTPVVSPAALAQLPGWRGLRGLRSGRIIIVDTDLFSRPGPRLADAARLLAGALHPGWTPR